MDRIEKSVASTRANLNELKLVIIKLRNTSASVVIESNNSRKHLLALAFSQEMFSKGRGNLYATKSTGYSVQRFQGSSMTNEPSLPLKWSQLRREQDWFVASCEAYDPNGWGPDRRQRSYNGASKLQL